MLLNNLQSLRVNVQALFSKMGSEVSNHPTLHLDIRLHMYIYMRRMLGQKCQRACKIFRVEFSPKNIPHGVHLWHAGKGMSVGVSVGVTRIMMTNTATRVFF